MLLDKHSEGTIQVIHNNNNTSNFLILLLHGWIAYRQSESISYYGLCCCESSRPLDKTKHTFLRDKLAHHLTDPSCLASKDENTLHGSFDLLGGVFLGHGCYLLTVVCWRMLRFTVRCRCYEKGYDVVETRRERISRQKAGIHENADEGTATRRASHRRQTVIIIWA